MAAWGLKLHQEGDRSLRLPEGDDQGRSLRHLQASAPQRQQQDNTPAPYNAHNLGCCLGLLVALQNIASVVASREDPEGHSPLAVDSSLELYGVVLMLVICVVALWEGGRHCFRRAEAVRMRSFQADQRLSKKEMRRLNQLLQQDPDMLSVEDKGTLMSLAEKAGVDLTKILTRESTKRPSYPTSRWEEDYPPPPPPEAACAADEDFLRRRRRERSGLQVRSEPPLPKRGTELYEVPEPPQVAAEILGGLRGRSREVGIQVELLQEMPRTVYTTPSGSCIHATRDCSTLNKSTKYIQKDVCAKCIPGQREVVVRPH